MHIKKNLLLLFFATISLLASGQEYVDAPEVTADIVQQLLLEQKKYAYAAGTKLEPRRHYADSGNFLIKKIQLIEPIEALSTDSVPESLPEAPRTLPIPNSSAATGRGAIPQGTKPTQHEQTFSAVNNKISDDPFYYAIDLIKQHYALSTTVSLVAASLGLWSYKVKKHLEQQTDSEKNQALYKRIFFASSPAAKEIVHDCAHAIRIGFGTVIETPWYLKNKMVVMKEYLMKPNRVR